MSFDFSANFVDTGTSQTWIKPAGLTTAYFYVNGAGGAGNTSSASGGGGAYSLSIYNFLDLGKIFLVLSSTLNFSSISFSCFIFILFIM